MMGHTHAVSAAAVWLGAAAGMSALGVPESGWHVVAGTVVCAGAGLLPDLDHPQATVARALGPVTVLAARGIAALSAAVHDRTRTRADRTARNGHRTLTHTWAFAAATGLLVSALCGLAGRWAVAVVFCAMVALGLRGLLGKVRGDLNMLVPGLSLGAGALALFVPMAGGWWWLGIPVAAGCLVHDLGDACTVSRCPILWPIPVNGQRWYPVGTPIRFRTSGWFEQAAMLPMLSLAALASSVSLFL